MTRRRPLLVPAIVVADLCRASAGRADPPHRSVQIVSTARAADGRGCSSIGSGLALGEGLVVTAAHVLLQAADLTQVCAFPDASAHPRIDVTLGAGPHTAAVIALGRRVDALRMGFAGSADYAILRIAVPMHSPPLVPCAASAPPGQGVIILTRAGAVAAHIALRQTPKAGDDARYVDFDRVVANGDSGAGVLDATTGCVMGIVSHRFPEPDPTVTRMVPVGVFAAAWRQARVR